MVENENDETCPRCGNYRPNGCLCHIPIPKFYTREDMARAWNEGAEAGEMRQWRNAILTPNPYEEDPPCLVRATRVTEVTMPSVENGVPTERQPLGAPCRYCGSDETWIEWRLEAKPVCSFSLAGTDEVLCEPLALRRLRRLRPRLQGQATRATQPDDVADREDLIRAVSAALRDELPEIGDVLRRRGEHIAEVAVDRIMGHRSPRSKGYDQPR